MKKLYFIYDEKKEKVVGSVSADCYLNLSKILDRLGAARIETDNPNDPDIMINGEKYQKKYFTVRSLTQI